MKFLTLFFLLFIAGAPPANAATYDEFLAEAIAPLMVPEEPGEMRAVSKWDTGWNTFKSYFVDSMSEGDFERLQLQGIRRIVEFNDPTVLPVLLRVSADSKNFSYPVQRAARWGLVSLLPSLPLNARIQTLVDLEYQRNELIARNLLPSGRIGSMAEPLLKEMNRVLAVVELLIYRSQTADSVELDEIADAIVQHSNVVPPKNFFRRYLYNTKAAGRGTVQGATDIMMSPASMLLRAENPFQLPGRMITGLLIGLASFPDDVNAVEDGLSTAGKKGPRGEEIGARATRAGASLALAVSMVRALNGARAARTTNAAEEAALQMLRNRKRLPAKSASKTPKTRLPMRTPAPSIAPYEAMIEQLSNLGLKWTVETSSLQNPVFGTRKFSFGVLSVDLELPNHIAIMITEREHSLIGQATIVERAHNASLAAAQIDPTFQPFIGFRAAQLGEESTYMIDMKGGLTVTRASLEFLRVLIEQPDGLLPDDLAGPMLPSVSSRLGLPPEIPGPIPPARGGVPTDIYVKIDLPVFVPEQN